MEEETEKNNEQEIEKPVLEGLRVLGRMIARAIYDDLLSKTRSHNDQLLIKEQFERGKK